MKKLSNDLAGEREVLVLKKQSSIKNTLDEVQLGSGIV